MSSDKQITQLKMASISATPRKTCLLSDACILCGFCFKQIEKASDGSEKIQKFSEIKLRLNEERWGNIRKLTGVLTDLDEKGLGGVCKKCYRQVESVLKIEAKNAVVKERFHEMAVRTLKTKMLQLPSPRRTSITKRMLRSPDTHVPSTKKKSFDVSVVKLVQLTPFKDLTNTRTDSSKAGLSMPVYTACIPIAPQEKQVDYASIQILDFL
ncbi:uncharacterized protein LOC125667567 isoform X1 [Ostrea edulis]|uniref:uncharacterized protein LOC125667567 isoform X1 n=2 Tax=Ostrea edulis TaxID=37623 RepID=UPI0024AFAD38|nr:uncharacterized protein LOC125667567 isoform X1 [Ostrea edulis]